MNQQVRLELWVRIVQLPHLSQPESPRVLQSSKSEAQGRRDNVSCRMDSEGSNKLEVKTERYVARIPYRCGVAMSGTAAAIAYFEVFACSSPTRVRLMSRLNNKKIDLF